MAAQIKDLRELTPKCKGINSRGDARERMAGAAKVLANTEPRTMAALVRVAMMLGESKKLREIVKDELYNMGRETHGTGFDEFKANNVTLEDVDYLDKVGLESVLDFLAAGAIIADSATEARQDTDIEMKKLKETVKKFEAEDQPMKKSLRDMKLNLRDINKEEAPSYDPYKRDSGRDTRDRDDRRNDRRRDDDRDGRRTDRDRYDRDDRRNDRDRDYDRDGRRNDRDRDKISDRDRQEATSRRTDRDRRSGRDRDDIGYDRNERRRDDDRTPSRDRRDNYDSRRDDRDDYRGFQNFATPLYEGFRKVIYGNNR